jgi:hypothetical protein
MIAHSSVAVLGPTKRGTVPSKPMAGAAAAVADLAAQTEGLQSRTKTGQVPVLLIAKDSPSVAALLPAVEEMFEGTLFSTPRLQQQQGVTHTIRAFQHGVKNVVLELPTGGGKSAIGHMVTKYFEMMPSYTTMNKVGLAEQYSISMPIFTPLYGVSNFPCSLDIEPHTEMASRAYAAVTEAKAVKGARPASPIPVSQAPCKTVKKGKANGTNKFQCYFAEPDEAFHDWKCSQCGETEILHFCPALERWHDIKDCWNELAPYIEDSQMCEYTRRKLVAEHSHSVTTTVDYYLRYPGFNTRPLAIYDEAHNLPSKMTDYYSLRVTTGALERWLRFPRGKGATIKKRRSAMAHHLDPFCPHKYANKFGIPELPEFQDEMLKDAPQLQNMAQIVGAWTKKLSKTIIDNYYNFEVEDRKGLMIEAERLQRFQEAYEAEPGNFVWNHVTSLDGTEFIEFKPVLIGKLSASLLDTKSDYCLFMSATIGDPQIFCKEAGLKPEDTLFLKFTYSDFDLSKRPIISGSKVAGGNMNWKGRRQDDFMDHALRIDQMARAFQDSKGMILPHSYDIQEGILNALRSNFPKTYRRIVKHTNNKGEKMTATKRSTLIEKFRESTGNQILISTYVGEGFDPISEEDDAKRTVGFAIVAKIPYLPLQDYRTRILMKHPDFGDDWYRNEAIKAFVQNCGRIVRSHGDSGTVVVIDPAFDWWFRKGREHFPSYIQASIDANKQGN